VRPISSQEPYDLQLIQSLSDLPAGLNLDRLAAFLHESLKPYEDTETDIRRALSFVIEDADAPRGFIVLTRNASSQAPTGAAVVHFTPWKGYVPENLLLYIAVDPAFRKRGIGRTLLEAVVAQCDGDIKLHVEYANPARRLYEQAGFTSKYAEMRLSR
jgi:[ribosomal protein S18]-alanine N-acetyltransferase